jgi:hypothetical protein
MDAPNPIDLMKRYPPEWDRKTGRQVFYCPECGKRLVGPPWDWKKGRAHHGLDGAQQIGLPRTTRCR